MQHSNLSQHNLLTDEVDINLNMLRVTMMNRIGRHINGTDVITIDDSRRSNRDVKFLKKLAQLATLGDSMGDGAILSLRAGAGNYSLAFGRPGDKVVTEVDAVAEGGVSRVGTTSPVGVGVRRQ